MRQILTIILLLLATNLLAKEPSDQWPNILHVRCNSTPGYVSNGSGSLLEGGYILSCNHIVREDKIRVLIEGEWREAKVIAIHLKHDWSVSKLDYIPNVPAIKLADARPVGRRCYAFGFGGGNFGYSELRCRPAKITGSGIVNGDSGGPILDADGRLISVISETVPSEGLVFGTGLAKLKEFLDAATNHTEDYILCIAVP